MGRLAEMSRRLAQRLGRVTRSSAGNDPSPEPSLPPQLTETGSRLQLEIPDGWSRDDVHALLASVSIDQAPPEQLAAYLNEDFERFLITWGLVRHDRGSLLEIGANPYFTTVLLWEFTALELTLTNCFDPTVRGTREQTLEYTDPRSNTAHRRTAVYESLDVESRAFPWPDESFDTVVFCEVIEHLTVDPVAALLEIHRVLKPGGTIVVSTPNVARLENVARLVAGANLYDPYSGYGAFGRHNREYTRHELVRLLEYCGFGLERHFTADVHAHRAGSFADPASLAPLVSERLDDLGQYLFALARKVATPRTGRPSELYRSMGTVRLASWDEPTEPDGLPLLPRV